MFDSQVIVSQSVLVPAQSPGSVHSTVPPLPPSPPTPPPAPPAPPLDDVVAPGILSRSTPAISSQPVAINSEPKSPKLTNQIPI